MGSDWMFIIGLVTFLVFALFGLWQLDAITVELKRFVDANQPVKTSELSADELEDKLQTAYAQGNKSRIQQLAPQIGVYDPATHIALEQATARYVQRTGNQPTEQQRRDFLFRGVDFSAGLYDREAER